MTLPTESHSSSGIMYQQLATPSCASEMVTPTFKTTNEEQRHGQAHGCADNERKTEHMPILFGPQGTITKESLIEMQNILQSNAALSFLSDTILGLPDLWSTVIEICPSLGCIPGRTSLDALVRFLAGAREPDALLSPEPLATNNIIMTTLTVVLQIIEFWKLTHGCFFNKASVDAHQSSAKISDVQGLCTGFLTAVCVSCARSETQFQALSAKALRLAMCLGAWIDLDAFEHRISSAVAVRWKSDAQLEQLNRTLDLYDKVSSTILLYHSTG
jgi:hypothetical protein